MNIEEYINSLSAKWVEITGRSPVFVRENMECVAKTVEEELRALPQLGIDKDEVVREALDLYLETRLSTPSRKRIPCFSLEIFALTALYIALARRGIPVDLKRYDTDTLKLITVCYKKVARKHDSYRGLGKPLSSELRSRSRALKALSAVRTLNRIRSWCVEQGLEEEAELLSRVIKKIIDKSVRA